MISKVVQKARELRKNQTPEEAALWEILKDYQLKGFKFRRQHPIGEYIADFCCPEKKLVIEIDGAGHLEKSQIEYDNLREEYLRARGFKTIRIWNQEIRGNLEGVVEKIKRTLV